MESSDIGVPISRFVCRINHEELTLVLEVRSMRLILASGSPSDVDQEQPRPPMDWVILVVLRVIVHDDRAWPLYKLWILC
jgi:hypothetical protein